MERGDESVGLGGLHCAGSGLPLLAGRAWIHL